MKQKADGQVTRYWLRPLAVEDLPRFARWMEQVDDLAMFDRRMPLPLSAGAIEAQWRESLLAQEPRTSYWFVIVDEDDEVVGATGLEEINYAHGNAVVPMFIDEDHRGCGVGLRALGLVLDLAFNQLRLARLTTYYRVDNGPSEALCAACGFEREGLFRKGWFAGGEFIDVAIVGLLAEEWPEKRKAVREGLGGNVVVTLGGRPSGRWSWPAQLD